MIDEEKDETVVADEEDATPAEDATETPAE